MGFFLRKLSRLGPWRPRGSSGGMNLESKIKSIMEANKPFHIPHSMTKNLLTVSYNMSCNADVSKAGCFESCWERPPLCCRYCPRDEPQKQTVWLPAYCLDTVSLAQPTALHQSSCTQPTPKLKARAAIQAAVFENATTNFANPC